MKLDSNFDRNNKEQSLIVKAQHCNECIDWLDECKAECCSIISFDMNEYALSTYKDVVTIRKICTPDQAWYYKLRGVKYAHGTLFFPKKRFIAIAGRCVYVRKCELLDDDYRCKGHPDNKPKLCKMFTKDMVESGTAKKNGIFVTPLCLYKYKAMDL